MDKINPVCPSCKLQNVIFDFHKLPMKCQFCGNDLKEAKIEKNLTSNTDTIREQLIDIILKVAMQHHDDISKSDENVACDAADEILTSFPQIQLPLGPQDKDGICYYCGKMTNSLSGNPSEWCVFLCHKDDPGKVKHHHVGCVMQRLNAYEEIKELHKMQP